MAIVMVEPRIRNFDVPMRPLCPNIYPRVPIRYRNTRESLENVFYFIIIYTFELSCILATSGYLKKSK